MLCWVSGKFHSKKTCRTAVRVTVEAWQGDLKCVAVVRAMLGALGQQAGVPVEALVELRASLNPISSFDFGMLAALEHARDWQAK